jgi:hypothetical protein
MMSASTLRRSSPISARIWAGKGQGRVGWGSGVIAQEPADSWGWSLQRTRVPPSREAFPPGPAHPAQAGAPSPRPHPAPPVPSRHAGGCRPHPDPSPSPGSPRAGGCCRRSPTPPPARASGPRAPPPQAWSRRGPPAGLAAPPGSGRWRFAKAVGGVMNACKAGGHQGRASCTTCAGAARTPGSARPRRPARAPTWRSAMRAASVAPASLSSASRTTASAMSVYLDSALALGGGGGGREGKNQACSRRGQTSPAGWRQAPLAAAPEPVRQPCRACRGPVRLAPRQAALGAPSGPTCCRARGWRRGSPWRHPGWPGVRASPAARPAGGGGGQARAVGRSASSVGRGSAVLLAQWCCAASRPLLRGPVPTIRASPTPGWAAGLRRAGPSLGRSRCCPSAPWSARAQRSRRAA